VSLLLPSALGFRRASLTELPHHVGMWSQPELSTALRQRMPCSLEHQKVQSRLPRIIAGVRLALAGLSALA